MLEPRVKHIAVPRIQHHTTDEGPPRRSGVLSVVAMQEGIPMMLNAKLIVAKLVNSRLKEGL
jgi:hypothetical protein